MFSLVLLAAMTGSVEASHHHYFVAEPCLCCHWPIFPAGGTVVFFWAGPAGLSEFEEKEWQEYLSVLDEADKADAVYYWNSADKNGKRMLLSQVRVQRAKKDAWAAKKKEDELRAKKELEEAARREAERKAKEAMEKEKKAIEKIDPKPKVEPAKKPVDVKPIEKKADKPIDLDDPSLKDKDQ